MNAITVMATGAGLGCLAMYELDPEMGRRRRAQARDKMIRMQRKASDAAAVAARDLKNRTLGSLAEARGYITEGDVSDAVLEGRVRSELGFLVRYPSFIDVQVENGEVTLTGRAFTDECEQLIAGIRALRGVRRLQNHVQAHDRAEDFPGLEGRRINPKPSGRRLDIMQRHWAPATRLIVGIAALFGIGSMAYCLAANNSEGRESGKTFGKESRS
jgi:hypothetical protein